MCYAIPGKVLEINGRKATIDYFGEQKQAYNELVEVAVGDYIYAQGGFIITKVPPDEAQKTLDLWKEVFFKLKEVDLRLSQEGKTLQQIANAVRSKNLGNSCCVHGILEFSNYCQQDCLFCGIRKSNQNLQRYRMTVPQILEAVDNAVNNLGFKALVLQSSEDPFYTEELLVEIVKKIKEKAAVLLFMSVGERDIKTYEKLYEAGARGVLLRFESSNPELYEKNKPGQKLETRIDLLKKLYSLGYLLVTGALIGLPDQTESDILHDIELTKELKAEMFSMGPFIAHPDTPLKDFESPKLQVVLDAISRARIMDPEAKIVVTTALQTIDPINGSRLGLMAGANSLMINVTPKPYRNYYSIYPNRFGEGKEIEEQIKETLDLLYSLGRAPTDLGI